MASSVPIFSLMMMLKWKIILPNDIWSTTALKPLQIIGIIIHSCQLLCHKYNPLVIHNIVCRNGNLKKYWKGIGNYKSRLFCITSNINGNIPAHIIAMLCGVLNVIFNSLSIIFLHIYSYVSVVGIVIAYRLCSSIQHLPSYTIGTGGSFVELKRPGHKADYSPPL